MKGSPLKGIRIIDLTHSWAGPHATRILADFGAEVIRVEYPGRLCIFRGGKTQARAYNRHPPWFQINRNKLSLTLDLKIEEDRRALEDLVKVSDVFVENSRTGVMARLGFDFRDLVKIRPDIIMLSMAAFGNSGPYAQYAGYGATLESVSGIQSLTAYERKGKTFRIREMDVVNGIAAAGAVMTALVHRQKTGHGQHIDFSHMEAPSHALMGEHLLEYAMNGTRTLPLGNRHPRRAPQGCYACRGEDKWVTLSIRSDEEWRRFCEVSGHPEWKQDPRFATQSARSANHDEVDRLITEWTKKHGHIEAMQILQEVGIPSGAVLDAKEIPNDPHLRERGYFVHGVGGSENSFMGVPFRLSEGEGRVKRRGPDLGEHNEVVLCELLGRPKERLKPIDETGIGTAYDSE